MARTDGFELISPTPREHFNEIFSEEADAADIKLFIHKMNKEEYYEVVEGLNYYLVAYSKEALGTITRKEFSLLLRDFFASSPLNYEKVVKALFQ